MESSRRSVQISEQSVKKRFAESPVKLVGLGSTEEFHSRTHRSCSGDRGHQGVHQARPRRGRPGRESPPQCLAQGGAAGEDDRADRQVVEHSGCIWRRLRPAGSNGGPWRLCSAFHHEADHGRSESSQRHGVAGTRTTQTRMSWPGAELQPGQRAASVRSTHVRELDTPATIGSPWRGFSWGRLQRLVAIGGGQPATG